jgi:PEP-CTERM motif
MTRTFIERRVCVAIFAALAASTMFQASALADTLEDNINGSATPPYVYYGGPDNIGWYYTAGSSYSLDGIYTYFEPVTYPNQPNSQTITVQIWTDRPANGGVLLGSGTFSGDSAIGGSLGANFSPVDITAGQSYFVDYLNTIYMGVNLGQWTMDNGNNVPSAGATTNLGAWYSDNGTGTFPDSGAVPGDGDYTTGNVSFSEPILYFYGNPISEVPEPSMLWFLLAGFVAVVWVRRTRSASL